MGLFATLRKGKTYSIGSIQFIIGEERLVSEELYNYLGNKDNFSIRSDEPGLEETITGSGEVKSDEVKASEVKAREVKVEESVEVKETVKLISPLGKKKQETPKKE